jgi:hypothetical protein
MYVNSNIAPCTCSVQDLCTLYFLHSRLLHFNKIRFSSGLIRSPPLLLILLHHVFLHSVLSSIIVLALLNLVFLQLRFLHALLSYSQSVILNLTLSNMSVKETAMQNAQQHHFSESWEGGGGAVGQIGPQRRSNSNT